MVKRVLSLLLVFSLLAVLTGCSSNSPAQTENKTKSAPKVTETPVDPNTVNVAYISASQTSPQPIVNIDNSIIGDELKKVNKKVKFTATRSLDNIWPLMDKEKGGPDFVYIPIGNYATYVTGTSRFGGKDKYTVIAGSMNLNGSVIIARPGIKTLKDLDGKRVGIANLRYADEYQLEKVLATVGLATEASGGTVKIGWDDIVSKTMKNFGEGKYDAVCMYGSENYPVTMKMVPGSKILSSLNPNKMFGKEAPRYWLVAKKEIVKNNPEIVKAFLRGHVLSTEKAIVEADKLPAIAREVRLQWFREQKAQMTEILKQNTLEAYQKRWKSVEATYDPNVKYATEIFNHLTKKGLMKGKSLNQFLQTDLLKEVLQEMGKPSLAN